MHIAPSFSCRSLQIWTTCSTALGSALSALHVDRPNRAELCAAVLSYFSPDSKRQNLTTSFSSALFAAGEVGSPILDVLPAGQQCSIMSIIEPATS